MFNLQKAALGPVLSRTQDKWNGSVERVALISSHDIPSEVSFLTQIRNYMSDLDFKTNIHLRVDKSATEKWPTSCSSRIVSSS